MGCPELKGIDMPSAGNVKDLAVKANEEGVAGVAGDVAGDVAGGQAAELAQVHLD